MAKFDDYAKDEIEEEIGEAAEQDTARKAGQPDAYQLPERFVGKTPEEIAQSYEELSQLSSRQANDLGTMRQTVDNILQSNSSQQEPLVEREPISVDDVYDNPGNAIQRGIDESPINDRITQLENDLVAARQQTRLTSLDGKFEGWQEIVQSPEFINWAGESPYRTRLVAAANDWDMDAAEDVLTMYTESQNISANRADAEREGQLTNAGLESGTAEVNYGEPTFSRAELLQHRINAKHGIQESVTYMAVNADAIAIAYEGGNITD
jgi:hypothetical protein